MKKERIQALDSFRGIAILMVLFFHFFSRWTSLYPYEDKYDYFRYGKFGVHFFFMISGFVIFYTMDNTDTFKKFWMNRYVRLLPSMFFASIFTYFFFVFFDTQLLFPNSHYYKNILVSLTFIQPDLFSSLVNYKINFDYISGSYWSLWVEIQFYLFASLIYFIFPKKFQLYFFLTAIIILCLNYSLSNIYKNSDLIFKIESLRTIFNLIHALPLFCIGSVFYILYKNNKNSGTNPFFLKVSFVFFLFTLLIDNKEDLLLIVIMLFFILLFFLMIYYPRSITFLNNRFLNIIGVSSYFLYLIHENLGVFLIHLDLLKLSSLYFIQPLIIILLIILLSVLFTRYIEKHIIHFLKKLVIKNR